MPTTPRVNLLLAIGAIAIAVWPSGTSVSAQTLSSQLLKEGIDALASAAEREGDALRGSLIFPSKRANCVACHAGDERESLGPNLRKLGAETTPAAIVESILMPSKQIKKGFECVKVLTSDGRVIVGRLVRESDAEITLREATPPYRLSQLARAEVDRRVPNPQSTMPAGLADQLENRQQFLDLVKYLLQLARSGASTSTPQVADARPLPTRIAGLSLIDHYGCENCHAGSIDGVLDCKVGPDLSTVASRIDPVFIERYLTDPHAVAPGTSMPDPLATLAQERKATVARAITGYLRSRVNTPFEREPLDAEAAKRGNARFHEVGCVACHGPLDPTSQLSQNLVPLDQVASKFRVASLVAFLENPHATRPSGRMPNLQLTHWEAKDIANYLLSNGGTVESANGDPSSSPDDSVLDDPTTIAAGKRYFQQFNCALCHRSPQDARGTFKPLAECRPDQGCLSDRVGAWPRYKFDDADRAAIRRAMQQAANPITRAEQVQVTLNSLRCYACHARDGFGGISDDLDEYFHTDNPNLGPQGRIPPDLTDVGAKLKSKWLRAVLVGGRSIRPYMKTRMPQFGARQVAHLVDLLPQTDQVAPPAIAFGELKDAKAARQAGAELVGDRGLNCVACHTFRRHPSQTMSAVDLTEMSERLRRDWFYRYLLNPQAISAGSVMPSYWPGGKAMRTEMLDGDTGNQIEAIWQYLQEGRHARVPRGLHREPIELLAGDEAVMLRRSYRDVGKRGIGVGYPGGVNLVFDAEQMRLAMIWKGKFADPGAVWRGQGSGAVRPLGSDLVRFATGPDLQRSPGGPAMDPHGRPTDMQFRGYLLDQKRRPTFQYRFRGIDVEDGFVDQASETGGKLRLTRRLQFRIDSASGGSTDERRKMVLRVAQHEAIRAGDENVFQVGDQLSITIVTPQTARIDREAEQPLLLVPIDLSRGESNVELHYDW